MDNPVLTPIENLLVENYVDLLIALVEHGNMPQSTWEQEPHHFRLISGCEDEEFNAIFSLEEPISDPARLKHHIQKMQEAQFPFNWVLRDHPDFLYMEAQLTELGMKKESPSQGLIGPPKVIDLKSDVQILPVHNEHQLELWLDLYEKSFFDHPVPLMKLMFRKVLHELGLNESSPMQADIALYNDEPVGCNLMFYSHNKTVGGFWCVGTLPKARGKGVAKALIQYRMQEMIDQGIPHAVTWVDKNATLLPHFNKLGMEMKMRLNTFGS